mgnify:CR=1 FL=1
MIIYPAIDIKDGKCVRLLQGRMEEATVYEEDPVAAAQKWAEAGARFLHVVDLDGALRGESENIRIVRKMVKTLSVPIQMGGGIRTMEKIQYLFEEIGVGRVIIGTASIENPDLVREAVSRYGSRIAVGIDAKNGKAAIRGWTEESNVDAVDLAKAMKDMGVKTIIYTDIMRDGMLTGPNFSATRAMVEQAGVDIIASGGISHIDDVRILKKIGVSGVIIGKALYTNRISLTDALKVEEE